jgi:uncharacterized protein YdcH (DUF465 family)
MDCPRLKIQKHRLAILTLTMELSQLIDRRCYSIDNAEYERLDKRIKEIEESISNHEDEMRELKLSLLGKDE